MTARNLVRRVDFAKRPMLDICQSLFQGQRTTLAHAITLIESSRADHKIKAKELLARCLEAKSSEPTFRIGISGPPGAGKSTFIEKFGCSLLDGVFSGLAKPSKLAVLAVDPSSKATGGSLLADKTRMVSLACDPSAFIRPSPNGCNLGGVARTTGETILLCESNGFPLILVETVGVGQSEYSVAEMVDLFVLVIPPAGGDELQGLKRGIVEFADIVLVNKADGDLKPAARRIATEYSSALKFMRRRHETRWTPSVQLVSSVTGEGLDQFWKTALDYREMLHGSGELERLRNSQLKQWMWSYVREGILQTFLDRPDLRRELVAVERQIEQGALAPGPAADHLINLFKHSP